MRMWAWVLKIPVYLSRQHRLTYNCFYGNIGKYCRKISQDAYAHIQPPHPKAPSHWFAWQTGKHYKWHQFMAYVVYSNHLMSSGTQSPSLASFCNLPKLILCRGMCLGSGTAPPAENAVASGKFNTQTISPSPFLPRICSSIHAWRTFSELLVDGF